MTRTDTILILLIIVAIALVPISIIALTHTAHPYYIHSGEPVLDAADAAGIGLVYTEDVFWSLPGAQGGKIYILGDKQGNMLNIQTQTFESEETRNAAIVTYSMHVPGRGKPYGTLVVIGDHLISISHDEGGIYKKIAPYLDQIRSISL